MADRGMAQTPEEKARARLLAQVLGAAAAAEARGQHEGHWTLHHIALPRGMRGDFAPYPAPEYVEEEFGILALLGELLGLEHYLGASGREMEAGS
jgi:hypothetical protein